MQTLGPNNGGLSLNDPYEVCITQDFLFDGKKEKKEFEKMDKFFWDAISISNYKDLMKDNYTNIPIFYRAFYFHFIVKDLKAAK